MASKFRKFSVALSKIDVKKTMLRAAKTTAELALDLNRVQMSELSIDSEGKPLGNYAPSTVVAKRRKGQPTSHITLRDSGDFQDDMYLDAEQIPIFIDSKDSKTKLIEKRWPKALGLYPPFAEQYKEKVMEVFRDNVNKQVEKAKKILH